MDLIAHPFRLGPNGSVATVTDGTDDAAAQHVAIHALTVTQERDLVPAFGVTDPRLATLDVDELNVNLREFGHDRATILTNFTIASADTVRIELQLEEDPDAVS